MYGNIHISLKLKKNSEFMLIYCRCGDKYAVVKKRQYRSKYTQIYLDAFIHNTQVPIYNIRSILYIY